MTPADSIRIRLSPQVRLGPVVRLAVLHAAHGSGVGRAEAARLASSAVERFVRIAHRAPRERASLCDLSIAIEPSRTRARVRFHLAGKGTPRAKATRSGAGRATRRV